jgi:hypothetical protein
MGGFPGVACGRSYVNDRSQKVKKTGPDVKLGRPAEDHRAVGSSLGMGWVARIGALRAAARWK